VHHDSCQNIKFIQPICNSTSPILCPSVASKGVGIHRRYLRQMECHTGIQGAGCLDRCA
jgi:hypothetical protein